MTTADRCRMTISKNLFPIRHFGTTIYRSRHGSAPNTNSTAAGTHHTNFSSVCRIWNRSAVWLRERSWSGNRSCVLKKKKKTHTPPDRNGYGLFMNTRSGPRVDRSRRTTGVELTPINNLSPNRYLALPLIKLHTPLIAFLCWAGFFGIHSRDLAF